MVRRAEFLVEVYNDWIASFEDDLGVGLVLDETIPNLFAGRAVPSSCPWRRWGSRRPRRTGCGVECSVSRPSFCAPFPPPNRDHVVVVWCRGCPQPVELAAQLLLSPFEDVPVDAQRDGGVAVTHALRQG